MVNCLKVAPQSALFFALTDLMKDEFGSKTTLNTHMQSFIAGTLAGVISQIVVYPLEPVKTCLTVAPKDKYTSIFDCARQLVRTGGVAALYRGMLPTVAGCVPYAGTQRLSYDFFKSCYLGRRGAKGGGGDEVLRTPPVAVSFGCGLLSSCLAMTVSYPFILVRTRLQVQGTRADKPIIYSGMSHCFWHVVRHEGPAALMRGILPNLGKAAPAAAINFALYDWIRALMMGDAQGREGTNLDNYFQRPGNPFISTSREREGEGERRRQRGRGGRDCGETASQG